jgi:hypothetical protein
MLGRCSLQLRNSCAGAKMVHSRAERVFILKHYFASKSFAAVRKENIGQTVANIDPETLCKVARN